MVDCLSAPLASGGQIEIVWTALVQIAPRAGSTVSRNRPGSLRRVTITFSPLEAEDSFNAAWNGR
jgi:hypothetical protein